MGHQAWQGSHSTPCSEQPGRVKHKARAFLGTLRSPQHIPLCPQSQSLNRHCLRGWACACLLQVAPPAFPLHGDQLLALESVIRKWRAFKNTAVKSNKNNRAGTYVSPQGHHLLLTWIEVFYHQSMTACWYLTRATKLKALLLLLTWFSEGRQQNTTCTHQCVSPPSELLNGSAHFNPQGSKGGGCQNPRSVQVPLGQAEGQAELQSCRTTCGDTSAPYQVPESTLRKHAILTSYLLNPRETQKDRVWAV